MILTILLQFGLSQDTPHLMSKFSGNGYDLTGNYLQRVKLVYSNKDSHNKMNKLFIESSFAFSKLVQNINNRKNF